MALKSTAKAEALARDLAEKLKKRLAGSATIDTVREDKDANGWPLIFLSDGGTETAGNPVILIRIKGDDAVSKDIFGNAITAAAPHTTEVAYEKDGTEGEPSRLDLTTVLFETIKMGTKIAIKEIDDATAVTESAINAASADKTLDDLYWPTKSV